MSNVLLSVLRVWIFFLQLISAVLQQFKVWVKNNNCIHFAATAQPSSQFSHNASTPLSPESA